MIQLYGHQQKSVDEIIEKFETHRKILYQLPTGGGKTFIFSFLTQKWIEDTGKRVLILCHRIELVEQTIGSLNSIGVTCEAITSKVKHATHNSQCYVAMIETASRRLETNPYFFKNVGLVISDECHILIFDKVFKYFLDSKILGCTATPVVLKRLNFYKCRHCKTIYDEMQECCDDEVMEWTKPFTMSMIYEDIVVGASIQDLINDGKLIQETPFSIDYVNTDNLKKDSDGEFTTQSIDEVYANSETSFNVLLQYEKFCIGKKTMIFNSSSKSNKMLFEKFVEAGYNVRMFDSVNKMESGCRKEVVKWFKENDDAVLLNVGVFTTGFDVTDVLAIILNRPTNSLSLFLQMVGRGGRPTKNIYKDNFILIDGGKNIDRHQLWSDPTRDWRKIFFNGTAKEKEKAKRESLEDIQECENCGFLYPKTLDECENCGTPSAKGNPVKKAEGVLIAKPIREIPPPNAEKIYLYTLSKNENINFSWRILINQIFDMFKYYQVTESLYLKTVANGKLKSKVKEMIRKCYFILISKTDIASGVNRTLNYLYQKVIKKLEEYYGK